MNKLRNIILTFVEGSIVISVVLQLTTEQDYIKQIIILYLTAIHLQNNIIITKNK